MLEVGQELVHALSGERYLVRSTAASSGGALFQVETLFAPSGFQVVAHRHPLQEERFVVLDGHIRVQIGRHSHLLAGGDTLVIPPDAPHRWRSDHPCRALIEFRPALQAELVFETIVWLAQSGCMTRNGLIANPLLACVFVERFWSEVRYTGLLDTLARFGRTLAPAAQHAGIRLNPSRT